MIEATPTPLLDPPGPASHPDGLDASAAGPARVGYLIIVVFFLGLGGWAATAPLNAAVVGDGIVSVEGNRKSVQHLEGGIVKEVRVKDGDSVRVGDIVAVLDDTALRAGYDIYAEQMVVAEAAVARLTAELNDAPEVIFPDDLTSNDKSYAQNAMAVQRRQFEARKADLVGSKQVLAFRVDELTAQIAGRTASMTTAQAQMDSINSEKAIHYSLLENQLTTSARLFDIERSASALQGQIDDARASNASARSSIEELKQQIIQLDNDQRAQVAKDLAETQAKILELLPRLRDAGSALERTIVRAPSEGKIIGLRVFTSGAVIAPGGTILDIVPEQDPLVIQARVRVEDISDIRPGMPAEVRFTSYRQRDTPLVHGTVRQISADRLIDDKTNQAYYQVEVDADRADLAANPQIKLYPGMPATVLITTKARTAFQYLFGPLTASFDRAFKQK